jgi:hypothetical protein
MTEIVLSFVAGVLFTAGVVLMFRAWQIANE